MNALEQLSAAKGLDVFIKEAVTAGSEIDALTFQQIDELLAGYNRAQEKIVDIFIHNGLPVAHTENGDALVAFPLDYFRWTPYGENLLKDFHNSVAKKKFSLNKKIAWVTGAFSFIAKSKVLEQGFEIQENMQIKIELMNTGKV